MEIKFDDACRTKERTGNNVFITSCYSSNTN